MNSLLLLADEYCARDRIGKVTAGRAAGLLTRDRYEVGDEVRVIVLGQFRGRGTVREATTERLIVEITSELPPPPRLPVTLLLAAPRPLTLRRVLFAVTLLGVEEVIIFPAERTERSYLASPKYHRDELDAELHLAQEQAFDPHSPEVRVVSSAEVAGDVVRGMLIVCDERGERSHPFLPRRGCERVTLAIGPEGGWTEREVLSFTDRGGQLYSLGDRILRVEVATTVALGEVAFLLRQQMPT